MESEVQGRAQVLSVPSHRKGLVAEGGERSESPEKPDRREDAHLRREDLPGVCKAEARRASAGTLPWPIGSASQSLQHQARPRKATV